MKIIHTHIESIIIHRKSNIFFKGISCMKEKERERKSKFLLLFCFDTISHLECNEKKIFIPFCEFDFSKQILF